MCYVPKMWLVLWLLVLCLVHIQFRYCSAVTVCMLKIVEASLIVAAVQIYFMEIHVDLIQNMTDFVQALPNLIPKSSNDL